MGLHRTRSEWFGRFAFAGMVAALLLPVTAWPQSLADVARQEEARRKAAGTGKAYTNDDLKPVPPATPAPPAPPAGAAAPGAAPADQPAAPPAADGQAAATPAPAEQPKKDEAWWKKRIAQEREALDRSQTFADALQSRINALTMDFARRDDPVQRNTIALDRQKAANELDRVKAEITQHKKAIGDIQEEARRAGVPAGWTR